MKLRQTAVVRKHNQHNQLDTTKIADANLNSNESFLRSLGTSTRRFMTAGSTTWINDVISKLEALTFLLTKPNNTQLFPLKLLCRLTPMQYSYQQKWEPTPFYGSVAQVEVNTRMEHNQCSAKQPSLRNRWRFVR